MIVSHNCIYSSILPDCFQMSTLHKIILSPVALEFILFTFQLNIPLDAQNQKKKEKNSDYKSLWRINQNPNLFHVRSWKFDQQLRNDANLTTDHTYIVWLIDLSFELEMMWFFFSVASGYRVCLTPELFPFSIDSNINYLLITYLLIGEWITGNDIIHSDGW